MCEQGLRVTKVATNAIYKYGSNRLGLKGHAHILSKQKTFCECEISGDFEINSVFHRQYMASINIQKFYADRDTSGPEFDDALIRLVRINPAIYDVNHPNYRRNPVRVAIWDRIAKELEAPSKFLQTKWKNIRYNYLQEIKVLETGHPNANIRKRRFTEDLSFLQNTAQTYNVKKDTFKNASYNSSDNESNSIMCANPEINSYEIIELDQSDEEENELLTKQPFTQIQNSISNNENGISQNSTQENITSNEKSEPQPDVTIEQTFQQERSRNNWLYPKQFSTTCRSNSSSPLLTPMVVMGNGQEHELVNGNEVTIEPIVKSNAKKRPSDNKYVSDYVKRSSTTDSFPKVVSSADPVELYCLSLVDTLKNMTRSERERVKFEFAKILKDATYKDQS